MNWIRLWEKAVLRGENPDIAEADLRLVQAGRYAKSLAGGL